MLQMLVKDFKTEISERIAIPADQQRLIFRGRVLQDDKKMSEYSTWRDVTILLFVCPKIHFVFVYFADVASNTIHVVQRPANSSNSGANDNPPTAAQRQPRHDMPGVVLAGEGPNGRNIFMGIGVPSIDIQSMTSLFSIII